MKKLLVGLMVFGAISAFANESQDSSIQEFRKPTFNGHPISAKSNPEAVCRLLTRNHSAKSMLFTTAKESGAWREFVVIKNHKMKLRAMNEGLENRIIFIMCSDS